MKASSVNVLKDMEEPARIIHAGARGGIDVLARGAATPGEGARHTRPFASSRRRPLSRCYAAHPGRRKE